MPAYPPTVSEAVWHAARSGDAEAIGRLCSSGGADPSGYKDPPTLSTALHEAVLGGHARCASLLLSLGADASARDRAGNTPLHACAASASADGAGAVELAEALLAKGEAGTVAAANGAGATPLHLAASRGKLALVRLLVENGAPLLSPDGSGRDPLSYAPDAATEGLLLSLIAGSTHQPRRTPGAWFAAPASAALADAAAAASRAGEEGRASMRGQAARGAECLFPPPIDPARPPPPSPQPPSGRRRTPHRAPLSPAAALHSRLLSAFVSADTDASGTISKRELYTALRAAGLHDPNDHQASLEMFNAADADSDGQLSFSEFAALCLRLGPLLDQPQNRPEPRRTQLSGTQPPGTHAQSSQPSCQPSSLDTPARHRLRRAFALFDADKSGAISLGELTAAFRHVGVRVAPEVLRRMFDAADADGSGGIDVTEFEALVERLAGQAGDTAGGLPPLAAGSAVTEVFRAYESPPGEIGAPCVAPALRMLGIDLTTRRAAALVAEAITGLPRVTAAAFGSLAHRLLTGDGIPTGDVAPSFPAETDATQTADASAARLSRAFSLAPSFDGATIAALDAPGVLWRARAVTDRSTLEALVPPPAVAQNRLGLPELRALAGQAAEAPPAAEGTPPMGAEGPALLLRALELQLGALLQTEGAVKVLCVAVEGLALGRATPHASPPAPLIGRSQLLPKREGPMAVELEAVLTSGIATVEARLLHAPLSGTTLAEATLASATLDLSALRAAAAAATASGAADRHAAAIYDVPLSDSRGGVAAVLKLSIAPLAPAFGNPTAPQPKPTPGGLASRQVLLERVSELEQTLRSLKARAAELQRKNEGYAEELRARDSPAVVVTGWRAAGVQALDATLRRLAGKHRTCSPHELKALEQVRQSRNALAAMAEDEEARVQAAAAAEFRRVGGFDVPS